MISAPLRSLASTTTVTWREPGDDPVPGREAPRRRLDARRVLGDDEAVRRRSGARAPRGRPGSRGRRRSRGRRPCAPPASSAPRCASPSTPRAMPLTTTRPAAASSRPNVRATCEPYDEQARAPTIATAGRSSRSSGASPAHEQPDRRVEDRASERREARVGAGEPADPAPRRAVRGTPLVEALGEAREARVPRLARRRGRRSRRRTRRARARSRRLQLARRAVAERLGDVLGQHATPSRRARRPSARHARRVRGRGPESGRRSTARESSSSASGVAARPGGEQLRAPTATRSATARGRLGRPGGQLVGPRPRHGDDEVEAVEQRAGELVAERRRAAAASTSTPAPGRRGRRTGRGSSSRRAGSAPGRRRGPRPARR